MTDEQHAWTEPGSSGHVFADLLWKPSLRAGDAEWPFVDELAAHVAVNAAAEMIDWVDGAS